MFKAKGMPRILIGDVISGKTGVATATNVTIDSITSANPAVVTATSHGLSAGDVILIPEGTLTEMTELNGREFVLHTVATNTFQLSDETGATVNSTEYTAESTGGDVTLLESDEGSVTMLMNAASVDIDFEGDWNILDYDYGDVVIGDYVVSYQTDETSDIADAEWMYIPAELFEVAYVIEGA